MNEHLDWCRHRGLRPSTIAARRYHLRRFREWHGRDLLDVAAEDLRAFQVSLTTGAHARANYVKHLRAFYRWATERNLCGTDLVPALVSPKLPQHLPRPIPQSDLAVALINAPARLRPWLLLGAFAGLRACEVAILRAEDLDLNGNPPTVRVEGKGGKHRVVPLSPLIVSELRSLRRRRGWLFPALDRSGEPTSDHVSRGQVSHLASAYLHEIGSDSSFHALRHRFVTDVYADSYDIRLAQDLAGHASPRETALYAALVPGRAAEVIGRLAAQHARLAQGSDILAPAVGGCPA